MSADNSTATENALKCKIKYYHTVADNTQKRCDDMQQWFVRSLLASRNEQLLNEYVATHAVWTTISSELLDIKTTIGTYTNKRGESFQAHFSIHGHYLEKCSKWGDEPVHYTGNFNISQYLDRFMVVWNEDAKSVADLFEHRAAEPTHVRPGAAEELMEDDDEIEEETEEETEEEAEEETEEEAEEEAEEAQPTREQLNKLKLPELLNIIRTRKLTGHSGLRKPGLIELILTGRRPNKN